VRFGSVCSGIEAASVAWNPLGWEAAWLAEIEPFPCAVLAHHYPEVPNLGDMRTIARRVLTGEVEAPEVLTGGTPCQAFSVAGLRESLADERGNLTLKFVELADAIDHIRRRRGGSECIVVWENVPGVLSTKDNAFGCFLAGLAGEDDALVPPGGRWSDSGCVYGPKRAVAWRTLDAQYFSLAQRRRRVFVVASARAGFDPATVLFEWQGVRRDSAPSREAGQRVAACVDASLGRLQGCSGQDANHGHSHLVAFGGNNTGGAIDVAAGLNAKGGSGRMDFDSETFIAHSLRGEGFDASEDGAGRGAPLVPVAFDWQSGGDSRGLDPKETAQLQRCQVPAVLSFSAKDHGGDAQEDIAPTLRAGGHANSHANAGVMPAVAWSIMPQNSGKDYKARAVEVAQPLMAGGPVGGNQGGDFIQSAMRVRRLTPRECERLQGFPDDYTLVPLRRTVRKQRRNEPDAVYAEYLAKQPMAKDGPRYKALGNSWAVPCARWIGKRIKETIHA
jgi:DNA (cytosine-5)-methyltransferase 1